MFSYIVRTVAVAVVAACALGPLGTLAAPSAAPSAAHKPNFVIILIDDMGYGDIEPFGSKLNRTPNLDRLAAEGMKLTSFYCASLCTASRSQLMTGCYAKRVSMPDVLFPVKATGLSHEEKTIAELLKPQGYATMCIGKWHLGDQPEFLPTRRGFDHYVGLPYSNDMDGAAKQKKQDKGMPPLPLLRDTKVVEAPAVQHKLTQLYTEEAVKFIAANNDRPFFLYLPHTAVHAPLSPGLQFKGKSKNGDYGDWVEEVDWSVGRVLATIKELKLEKNTLVFFTGDNGATNKNGCNAPFRGYKGSTWEGGEREPAIAWWPGKIAAGSICDAVASELDLLPTLVGLSGGQVPTSRKIDGRDIWPLLSGQSKQSPHEALYYFLWGELQAVRSGPWKLAIVEQTEGFGEGKEIKAQKKTAGDAAPRLYHLDTDKGERTDVAARHPDVVQRLKELFSQMDGDLGVEKSKKHAAPGVRPAGHFENPTPLLMRSSAEYDWPLVTRRPWCRNRQARHQKNETMKYNLTLLAALLLAPLGRRTESGPAGRHFGHRCEEEQTPRGVFPAHRQPTGRSAKMSRSIHGLGQPIAGRGPVLQLCSGCAVAGRSLGRPTPGAFPERESSGARGVSDHGRNRLQCHQDRTQRQTTEKAGLRWGGLRDDGQGRPPSVLQKPAMPVVRHNGPRGSRAEGHMGNIGSESIIQI